MLTTSLITALKHSESPRIVRAIDWALEKRTGLSVKQTVGTFNTVTVSEWYARNGYQGIYGLGGHANHAGVALNEDSALTSSAFYSGVKIISEDMGSLPWFTYQRSADRKTVDQATGHPLFPTLKNMVNPETSSGEFVEALTAHAMLCGDGMASIERTASGGVFLWQWQPGEVRLDRDGRGNRVYVRKEGNSQEKTYGRRDVFHLRGFTLNGTSGDQVILRARHILGLTLAAQEYAGRYFANDATPGLVIKRPMLQAGQSPWGAETVRKIKEEWIKWHQGLRNKHEPAVLQDGAEVEVLTPTHEQSQLIQQRKFQVIEVARMIRIPVWKLADMDSMIQANAEQQSIEYLYCLNPWVERWKRAVHRCLLTTDEQLADRIYAEHDVKILLRADFKSQAEAFARFAEKGVYSINEIRRWLNLNPIEGGDSHFIQLNMATVQDVATGATLAKNETGTMPASGVRD